MPTTRGEASRRSVGLNAKNGNSASMTGTLSSTSLQQHDELLSSGISGPPPSASAGTAKISATQLTNQMSERREARARSSSIVSVREIEDSYDDTADQGALEQFNTSWVDAKGAWLIHIILIAVGKVLVDIVPGIAQDLSWTVVLQGYLLITFMMFHWVTGTPFEANNSGVADALTLWEQIDDGAQYTPAKKWLTSLPIMLFLVSTHYTRYDRNPALFTLNIVSVLLLGLAPKLPQLHRLRFKFFEGLRSVPQSGMPSGVNTPTEDVMVLGSNGAYRRVPRAKLA
ncbi:uncharacterized protein L969DRAFT_103410 [Mixia osmundae IAM 14324]|uniref:Uncharacterized protein n=1 Tax=Mixia osmundae (strain CBS 9802 / IAM 14324 / JCM 22182 / KY 12970) TaxID=764103 RepID=G7E0V4_MIXOS|nr:uncharacterized protein L969DRAFT_103410 [Mixia osmundae IAM 14324]KEI39494.1 hypothetical protein L969DRAFT_103410 [Mixia osmundae IAM 14324]GAA96464.1 hypothetical protein E5Q_03131 [Mixia osmundae IAM 14324]